jgi:hypothetical protein
VTPSSKSFVAVLAVLQAASTALYFGSKVRGSFGVSAATSLLVLLVTAGSWSQVTAGEILFAAGEGALALMAVAGLAGRAPLWMWWLVWSANLLVMAFLAYLAFFFHVF